MATEILWHAHANFQITSGGTSVLIDPFFTGNPTCTCSWNQAPKAEYILITHDHGDHVGDAIALCRATGALCCAIYETAFSLLDRGLPPELLGAAPNIGGTVKLGDIQVTLTPAVHTSETGSPAGYVVRMPDGFTLYHSGDTAFFGDMAFIGADHELDLALLPIGDVYTMNPKQAVRAAALLKPKTVIPMHWGTFAPLVQSPDEFVELMHVGQPHIRVVALRPGEKTSL